MIDLLDSAEAPGLRAAALVTPSIVRRACPLCKAFALAAPDLKEME